MADTELIYVASLVVEGQVYLRMVQDGKVANIAAFKTLTEGLAYYEGAYNRALTMGVGWTTGALLGWMQTQPRIHATTLDEIRRLAGPEPHTAELRGEATFEVGLVLPYCAEVKAFRQRGFEPRLTQ